MEIRIFQYIVWRNSFSLQWVKSRRFSTDRPKTVLLLKFFFVHASEASRLLLFVLIPPSFGGLGTLYVVIMTFPGYLHLYSSIDPSSCFICGLYVC